MNYLDYEPGRSRRLAYANMIRQRSRPEIGSVTFNESRRMALSLGESYVSTSLTYEVLSELSNIQVGLIDPKLIKSSRVQLNLFESNFCVICQENISTNRFDDKCITRVLDCKHCFHLSCIDTWFIRSKRCPTCKGEI
jgi:hypothetical protein